MELSQHMGDQNIDPSLPSLDWYLEIVEKAPEPIDIIDREGRVLYHNRMASPGDGTVLLGRAIYEFFLPTYHSLVRETIERVFQTGQSGDYELASQVDGKMYWYFTRIGPIVRDGKVEAATLFIRDITHMKVIEQRLELNNKELEKRVEERTQVLNNYASHLEALERLNRELRQAETRNQVLDIMAHNGLEALGADMVGIYRVSGRSLVNSYSFGHRQPPPPVLNTTNDDCFYHLLQTDEIKKVPLADAFDPHTCVFGAYLARENMQALLVAPLMSEKRLVSGLYFGYRSAHEFSEDDEQLLNSFIEAGGNTMHRIEVMEELSSNITERETALHVLFEIMSIASEAKDQETLLQKALSVTKPGVQYQVAILHMRKDASGELQIVVQEGFTDEMQSWFVLSDEAANLWEKVNRTAKMVKVRSQPMQSYAELTGAEALALAYLGIPIRSKGQVVGVLSYFGDESLLESGKSMFIWTVADQIGLAWDNLRQRKIAEETLILEERQRLAHDLHDSVSQSLYGLVLWANAGNKLLKLRSYPELSKTLHDIEDVAIQSLKEMRLLLFELRPPAFETEGLISALDLRLNTVERRAGMNATLDVVGREYLPRALDLEIYRIATEALNNSLRHSKASLVSIFIQADGDHLEMKISDDGQGFREAQVKKGGIGLISMKERAQKIGGTLTLDTSPGKGTCVHLFVPLNFHP
jgi:PAS domain S-box-containing protein